MRKPLPLPLLAASALIVAACAPTADAPPPAVSEMSRRIAKYVTVPLTVDTAALTPKEQQMLPLLVDAARAMDAIFWEQTYGAPDSLLTATTDPETKRFIEINYGPWDRLADDAPFVTGVGPKPKGANLYPHDLTTREFDSVVAKGPRRRADSLKSLYTLVRRDNNNRLIAVPYRDAYREQNTIASGKLRDAAALAEDPGLRTYLELRAAALLTDDYRPSDLAWMDMKSNTLDIVIGPIETYEDALYGYKATNESYVLIKDKSWSERLAKYVGMLPALQRGIPVPAKYKQETPGAGSDLGAYDAVFYAGEANAGAKTIAINLPNDEYVQLRKGARRLQLKNTMRAKFDKILMPIAQELIAADQLSLVHFDAFFENVMFHEVAHGLGIKKTITRKGTVRTALKDRASALEEQKADVLGLYMVETLAAQGQLSGGEVNRNYIDFLASLFRSARFGASDAHGRANVVSFNFLMERGAFARDSASGTYRVDFAKMKAGIAALAEKILTLQGDGDYDGTAAFQTQYGTISPELRADLERLSSKGIPVDVVFQL